MKPQTPDIVRRVHHLLTEKGATVSVAESCTGGLLSNFLTSLPGSSEFFEAGIVSYSERSKERILGVPPKIISDNGMVSEETARAMAEKVRALTMTDFAIATTGNLGPGVLEGKAMGLVYIAVSGNRGTFARELRLNADREANREAAALGSLELLMEVAGP